MAPSPHRTSVRRLGEADWELLRDLRLASLADSPEAFGSTLERELEFDEAMWRSRCTTSASFVVYVEGAPRGLVGAFPVPEREVPEGSEGSDSIDVVGMWVAPEARRQGLGALLMNEVIELAREHRLREVTLWVAEGNGAAASMYAGLGFEPTGTRDHLAARSDRCQDQMRYRIR